MWGMCEGVVYVFEVWHVVYLRCGVCVGML